MQRAVLPAVLTAILSIVPAQAQNSNLGGGFIEFLFGGAQNQAPRYHAAPAQPAPAYGPPPVIYAQPPQREVYVQPQVYAPQRRSYEAPSYPYGQSRSSGYYLQPQQQPATVYAEPPAPQYDARPQRQRVGPPPVRQAYAPPNAPVQREIHPKFLPQEVEYDGPEKPGTIIVNTPERFLYLVLENGKARRYGIGVGRPGFTWAGEHRVTEKREWPDWRPPPEMIKRQPYLPKFMAGGPNNPLGARAMYLGSTLYRIHGSNEPWTIGQAVSSGCIRMRNEDVIELYNRVTVGTKVVVI